MFLEGEFLEHFEMKKMIKIIFIYILFEGITAITSVVLIKLSALTRAELTSSCCFTALLRQMKSRGDNIETTELSVASIKEEYLNGGLGEQFPVLCFRAIHTLMTKSESFKMKQDLSYYITSRSL